MKVRSLYILIIFSRILFSAGNNLGGSYSFANIPASAFSSSLGNTITSGISSPSSLQQNPANIWNNNKFIFFFAEEFQPIEDWKTLPVLTPLLFRLPEDLDLGEFLLRVAYKPPVIPEEINLTGTVPDEPPEVPIPPPPSPEKPGAAVDGFKCPICGQILSTKQRLDTHLKTHEKVEKKTKWGCPICNKNLSSKQRLDTHLKTHERKKTKPVFDQTDDGDITIDASLGGEEEFQGMIPIPAGNRRPKRNIPRPNYEEHSVTPSEFGDASSVVGLEPPGYFPPPLEFVPHPRARPVMTVSSPVFVPEPEGWSCSSGVG